MRQSVCSGMKEALGYRTLLSAIIFVIIIILSQFETILTSFPTLTLLPFQFHISFMINATNSNMVISFIPIVAVLPFAGAYIDEIHSNFARYLCIRSSYRRYITSRIVVSWITGGLIIGLSVVVAWGLVALVFIPMEKTVGDSSNITNLLVDKCLLFVLSGGLWSVVGMAMSTLMESKYISYSTPFVLYYLLVILYERYFSGLFIIYPKTWTDPTAWPFGCWGAAIFLLEMTLIFAFLFVYRAGRRLQQL